MNEINILSLLEQSAKDYPERIALRDIDEEVSYRNLNIICKKLAYLIGENLHIDSRNKPIVVYIDRNIKSIISFLLIVHTGNFYVPVDATFPKERLQAIMDTLHPVLQIDARKKGKPIENTVSLNDLFEKAGVSLDENSAYISKENLTEAEQSYVSNIKDDMIDTDPLYSIFTSGTTGVPKGVLISHRSVIDLVQRFDEVFDFPEHAIFGNQAPFDFDVSVKDIYNSLYQGGTVVIIPKSYFVMSASLLPYLKKNKVNVLIWAVSALRIVHNFKLFDACMPDDLRWIMFSGEVMPVRTLNYLKENLPMVKYVNLYGPTEITCNCNYYIVDKEYGEEETLPLGKSFPNTRVFLQDVETLETIKTAEKIGEICVEGTCLALGYYANEEQTTKAFVQKYGVSAYSNLTYRTGDLGKYDAEGNLFYVSRKDYQIKHMGHRIELGEIETVVNAMDQIHMACCVYLEEKELIILYYASEEPCDADVRAAIRAKLPNYMMPNQICYMETLPMNLHDKIDRKKLLQIASETKF